VRHSESRKKEVMKWQDLRAYGIEWHKKRGTDFSKLSI
jgi:hypothetical protein